ncbi:MAG: hypothetical protein PVI01_10415 [Gemmatimonadales bacterium]|jgi:hypothetical protein
MERRHTYRVTIRYQRRLQQYEIIEVEAATLRDAMSEAVARFPEELIDTSDLVEVRLANPPE